MELKEKKGELQKTLVILSVDEQAKKDRQGMRSKLLRDKRSVHSKEDTKNIPEE